MRRFNHQILRSAFFSFFFSLARLVCVTGQSAHERTDIVQVDVDQSGVGTSRESFSYLVSLLQSTVLPY